MTARPPGSPGPRRATLPSGPPEAAESLESPAVRRVVRQRAAQRRKARRRATVLQLVITTVAVVALIALVWVGWRSAMRITGGSDEVVTDPDAPGYVAEVRPTPVTLVALTGDGGELISMLVVVNDPSNGVTATPMSPQLTLWDFEDSPPESAAAIHADGGLDSLRLRLGAELGFGATEAIEVPGSALVQLAGTVGTLTVPIVDDVFAGEPDAQPGDVTLQYPAGDLELEPELVDDFLAFPGYREPDTNRSLRSAALWQELLEGVGTLPSAASLGGGEQLEQFVELLGEMQSQEIDFDVVPMTPVTLYVDPPVTIHRIDTEAMPAWASTHVPFPVAAFPGQLVAVAILDGTGEDGAIRSVAPTVVGAGAEVVLTGNAESLDLEESRVEYAGIEAAGAARDIASALGVPATQDDDARSDVDVTVVVGKDLLR